ncbi:hypothetical protein [Bacillus thuringiensis]|uniref:hypothetical protein n=1 Tax=Bacillus thuringiensis TaxID=1428 RepID=UPI000BF5FE39|nr:hypothetical protein [Bacillus thuringiensis]PFC28460.1 hypothetical protein CN299_19510 [Bacillus thuringiensis]
MKFGFIDVFDLHMFDAKGNHVTTIESLLESQLHFELQSLRGSNMRLFIKDTMMDTKLLEFMGRKAEKSDYEKMLGKTSKTISFGAQKEGTYCKLILSGVGRELSSGEDFDMTIEIPKVSLKQNLNLKGKSGATSDFDFFFDISTINDKDDLFHIHY